MGAFNRQRDGVTGTACSGLGGGFCNYGGGACGGAPNSAHEGASGAVILSIHKSDYSGNQSGGSVSCNGCYKIITYTSNGTYTA